MEMHIFTELVGLQMLLMNTLDPLLRGETMTPEQSLLSSAKSRQRRPHRAQELLAKAQSEEGEMTMPLFNIGEEKSQSIWPPRGYIYTIGAFFFACMSDGHSLMYVRFEWGLSPLQKYYLPYYVRTELAG